MTTMAAMPASGFDGGSALADRLRDPATVAALTRLLDRADDLARAVDTLTNMATRAPGYVAMAVDSADEVLRDANESGIDIAAGLTRGASAAVRFGALMGPDEVRSLEAVFRSGMLAPDAVRVIGGAGAALAAAAAEEPPPVGLMGLVRALRHADVRRALGFLLRFAVYFGRSVGAPSRSTVTPNVLKP